MLARPGAASRLGEAAAIRATIARYFRDFEEMAAPGTLDGGDVCEADDCAYIGLSARTNRAGAEQLAAFLGRRRQGEYRRYDRHHHHPAPQERPVVRGDGIFVAIDELLPRLDLSGGRVLRVPPG